MPTTTSRLSLTQPVGADAVSEYRVSITQNATVLDAAVLTTEGTISSRPAATAVAEGSEYYATDTGQLFKSTGSAWLIVPTAALTYTNLTLASGLVNVASDYPSSARVEGDRVVLRGSFENTGSNIVAGTPLFTLPSGMRPSAGLIYLSIALWQSSLEATPVVVTIASSGAFVTTAAGLGTDEVLPLNGLNFSLI
jgi:hypothetical protein